MTRYDELMPMMNPTRLAQMIVCYDPCSMCIHHNNAPDCYEYCDGYCIEGIQNWLMEKSDNSTPPVS